MEPKTIYLLVLFISTFHYRLVLLSVVCFITVCFMRKALSFCFPCCFLFNASSLCFPHDVSVFPTFTFSFNLMWSTCYKHKTV